MTDSPPSDRPDREFGRRTSPGLMSAAEFLRLWNSPSRPRLTPEEARDFAMDLEAIRRDAGSVPTPGIDD